MIRMDSFQIHLFILFRGICYQNGGSCGNEAFNYGCIISVEVRMEEKSLHSLVDELLQPRSNKNNPSPIKFIVLLSFIHSLNFEDSIKPRRCSTIFSHFSHSFVSFLSMPHIKSSSIHSIHCHCHWHCRCLCI